MVDISNTLYNMVSRFLISVQIIFCQMEYVSLMGCEEFPVTLYLFETFDFAVFSNCRNNIFDISGLDTQFL